METASLCLSVCSPHHFASKTQRFGRRYSTAKSLVVSAKKRSSGSDSSEWDYYCQEGRSVEESMIVLRKRIHQMKVIERNYEAPAEWADWEKQYYVCYDEYVCKFVGFLQLHLMNTRPSLALGMIFLITITVPISTALILLRLLELANAALSSAHLG